MTIVVRSVFQEGNKYYPQVFLDERLYDLEYDKIDISERIMLIRQMHQKNVIFVIITIFRQGF